ncbi:MULTISPECIES: hypothetical protein [Prauserella salsuginis group]|uniref:Uncharacterized protein n=2 Tax=Prauserella salsuginis group TaxID=2893672 RepID=A0A839XMW1_9PSEU|nr:MULTISPECIES: hypothetical protein [Prauserella salsuginis group]MBB3662053.1 hypothetical protein [Prauserella sediminis]MCR3719746.1 hypothetical protein [Prauserella flava]MCR3736711.1 hypothetical protein [Prauserella salsuginis]
MHERRHASEDCVAVEDVIDREILDDDLVDDAYLREALAEPGRYLPPPSVQANREPEPVTADPEPEHPVARRAKLIALIVATLMVVASIIAAAVVTGEDDNTAAGAAASLPRAAATEPVSFVSVAQPF